MEQTQEKIGKYTLVRHLATGGMAEIWLAEQEGPGGFNKQLVIKRVLTHLARDEHFTQMFLDEARLVARLTHPNIGQIFELGELEGVYFIAMEFIEGLDLSVIVNLAKQRGGFVPIGVAIHTVIQVLQALEYAHNFVDRDGSFVGLVHRDVTPHNVLVSNDGAVKLVDFGVAKAKANQSKTQTGAVKGKFAYMAPEQINSVADLDRRVDVFAAGVVLYEVLTGEKPFGDDLFAVNAIMSKPMPDPRELRPEIPQTIVNILELALAKDRDQRYQSAQTMMDDLEDFVRASNFYTSRRDVAAFVRDLQGLEMTGTWSTELSNSGPRARITEKERAVAPTPKQPASGEFVTSPVTGANATVSPAQTQPGAPPSSSGPQPTVTTPSSAVGGGTNTGLIAVFFIVILGILGAGGAAAFIAISGDGDKKGGEEVKKTASKKPKKDKKDKKKPKKDDKPARPKANPKALLHKDGTLVIIDANKKDAHVYYEGTFIGDTPIQTTLRPGKYNLIFEAEGAKKAEVITVEGKGLERFSVKF